MGIRRLIITILTFVAILIYFNVPLHKNWLNTRILNFTTNIHELASLTDLEARREFRWGSPYLFIKAVKQYTDSMKPPGKLVLLPPEEYYKQHIPNVTLPEPVICYYFAGMKTTTIDCEDVTEADGCVFVQNNQFIYKPIRNQNDLQAVLDLYKSETKKR